MKTIKSLLKNTAEVSAYGLYAGIFVMSWTAKALALPIIANMLVTPFLSVFTLLGAGVSYFIVGATFTALKKDEKISEKVAMRGAVLAGSIAAAGFIYDTGIRTSAFKPETTQAISMEFNEKNKMQNIVNPHIIKAPINHKKAFTLS